MIPVFRFEAEGEAGVEYPTLAAAVRYVPSSVEARVATSPEGVVLAEACTVSGPGSMLEWVLTNAGRDVVDTQGWTAGPPQLTPADVDTVLALALGDTDLRVAS